ncbi:hypothetical protein EV359DRAFT_68035 [Lentinula novae-zelandiae]|nr:hypothetical protein EV359DRAFT_68035 [Lentinula novae-zelandiae]
MTRRIYHDLNTTIILILLILVIRLIPVSKDVSKAMTYTASLWGFFNRLEERTELECRSTRNMCKHLRASAQACSWFVEGLHHTSEHVSVGERVKGTARREVRESVPPVVRRVMKLNERYKPYPTKLRDVAGLDFVELYVEHATINSHSNVHKSGARKKFVLYILQAVDIS